MTAALELFNGTPELYPEYVIKSGDKLYGQGKQIVWHFPNGYGASVILSEYSYGLEMAVLHADDRPGKTDGWPLCYRSGITDDVIGYIDSPTELAALIKRVKELPANDECKHRMQWPS